jgi:hypothetical protein
VEPAFASEPIAPIANQDGGDVTRSEDGQQWRAVPAIDRNP